MVMTNDQAPMTNEMSNGRSGIPILGIALVIGAWSLDSKEQRIITGEATIRSM
jgi:hypothetical protein